MLFNNTGVLGTPEIVSLQGTYFKIKYKVKLKKPKNFSNDILDRLLFIGFEIDRVGRYSITVLLPCHWWASKVKKSILFHDHIGRVRIILTKGKDIEFIKRYSVVLASDPIKGIPYKTYIGCILDYSTVTTIIPLTKDFKLNAVLDAKGDDDKLLKLYTKECHNYMDKIFPAWQVETMYWDDPVDEYSYYEDE